MDISKIKAKLSQLQSKGSKSSYEKIDYSKIFWKPKEGKQVIRIVPSKFNKDFPFREVFFHYDIVKRSMLALTNWGEKDPIVEFSKQLYKSEDKDDQSLARKLSPRVRVFAPVVVRGEEHLGTRLWEFGKEVYEQLLKIAADEDYGDITDIMEGTDLTVECVKAEFSGRSYLKPTIIPKRKTSALADDSEVIKKLLEEQPDILSVYKKYTFEEIKGFLAQWLNPEEAEQQAEEEADEEDEVEEVVAEEVDVEEDEEEDEEEEEDEDEEEEEPVVEAPKKAPVKKATTAKSVASKDKFDQLFGK